MNLSNIENRGDSRPRPSLPRLGVLLPGLMLVAGCGGASAPSAMLSSAAPSMAAQPLTVNSPSPDPRVGLEPGLFDAEEAVWNMRVVSRTPPPDPFVGKTNSDLAFSGNYAIQGNYDGVQIWDIANPGEPETVITFVCPASQSDVSVYGDLLFVSGEGMTGRLDCAGGGVQEAVSHHRLRGIRIFDITDIRNPEYVANVQTCRGSHTHTVLEDPNDDENVYIYVSGSAPVRPAEELEGCSSLMPEEDPNSALFRIEVIQVPLANPENAAIVSSPRIFDDLVAPESHGLAPDDLKAIEDARAAGKFIAQIGSQSIVLPDGFANMQIDSIMRARGGTTPNAADSASFREYLPRMFEAMTGGSELAERGPTQCHDITVFPAIGMAGGACEGYGLLLDISDPTNPKRLAAVADSNFSYWHSATFNNDGTQVVFTDEWGGGGGPKCRATDPKEWGANAIFTIDGSDLNFTSYYKMPAPQTSFENCVAHNGSLIPIPGRDIMVQSWYQGGISIFDWTDPSNPVEIAFHDRGPSDANTMGAGGSWSIYWYNGLLVSSEIARGLDIFELVASEAISQNEIDAANSVVLDELNSQGQPILEWPFTFALARAYVDQLERSRAVSQGWVTDVRNALSGAEGASDSVQADALRGLASQIEDAAGQSRDADKMRMLADAIRGLAGA
ncbi:MAG: LVIVD repeat-containing protein [Longimicrobiales bacterium]